jgi:hypothetical protein
MTPGTADNLAQGASAEASWMWRSRRGTNREGRPAKTVPMRRLPQRLPEHGRSLPVPLSAAPRFAGSLRCAQLPFPGPLLDGYRIVDCDYIYYARQHQDVSLLIGDNPTLLTQRVLYVFARRGGSMGVGLPRHCVRPRIVKISPPSIRISCRRTTQQPSDNLADNIATGDLTRARG